MVPAGPEFQRQQDEPGAGLGLAVGTSFHCGHGVMPTGHRRMSFPGTQGSRVAEGTLGVTSVLRMGVGATLTRGRSAARPLPPILDAPTEPSEPVEPREARASQGGLGWGAGAGEACGLSSGAPGVWVMRGEESSLALRHVGAMTRASTARRRPLQCGHMPGTGWVFGRACWPPPSCLRALLVHRAGSGGCRPRARPALTGTRAPYAAATSQHACWSVCSTGEVPG